MVSGVVSTKKEADTYVPASDYWIIPIPLFMTKVGNQAMEGI